MKIKNKDDILGTWFDAAITTHPRYVQKMELLYDIACGMILVETFDVMK